MQTLQQLTDKADELFDEEQYQQIIDLLPDSVLMQYNDPQLWHLRAYAHLYTDAHGKAIEDINKIIALKPDSGDAYCDRGVAWLFKGNYEKAMQDFDKAIALDPAIASAYYGRGEIWSEREKFDKAVEEHTKYINLRPHDMIGYANRGKAWQALEEYDKAITDFTMAIGIEPSSAVHWFDRGSARHDKINDDETLPESELELAIKDYSEAIRLDPEHQQAYCFRGILLSDLEKYEEAIKDLEKALELDPDDDLAKDGLDDAKIYLQKRDGTGEAGMSEKDKQAIRDKAATFLDELRKDLDAKFKTAKDAFYHGKIVESWDPVNQRPLVAGIDGWMPELRPDIAQWKEAEDKLQPGKRVMDVYTHAGEEFWPSLVGIPIKKDLWRAIIGYQQYRIGEKQLNANVKRFPVVNEYLLKIIRRIRTGDLDNQLVFGEYKLPTVMEDFEAMLTKIINTPYTPPKKKK